MLSEKNKKKFQLTFVLLLLLVAGFAFPQAAHAGIGATFGWVLDTAADGALYPFKMILYSIFVLLGWMTSMAVTLFEWAINPDYISGPSGILNKESVYTSWKFIRDFFNLFFILTLLYTAFTIVFQVAANYKKTLLSIVLAALFINFSFPITRVIIDVTNVPMYYFVNQMATVEGGETVFGNFLGASRIQEALIPDSKSLWSTSMAHLIMAIVMLFLFMISMLVMAVLMVVRLVALVILLIFSSVGFAASVIPGMQQFSSKWWDNLAKYALFGPAAMLMLLIATRFFAEIGRDDTKSQFFEIALGNSIKDGTNIVSSMAMFTVPVIMMWFAIGIGTSMSIAGAGTVTGLGQKFAKWAGKKTSGGITYPARKFASGVGQGAKARFSESRVGRYLARPSGIETFAKGATKGAGSEKGWRGGVATEREKAHQKQVNEQVKKNKENQVSDSTHVNNLQSNDRVEREAAALSLAESKGIRSADTLAKAISAVGDNNDAVAKILDSARSEAIGGINTAQDGNIRNAFYEKDATGKVKIDKDGNGIIDQKMRDSHDAYNSRLKREGNLKVRVDYEIARKMNEKRAAGPLNPQKEGETRTEVYEDLIGRLGADDLAKQGSIHSAIATDNDLKNYLKEKVDDEPKFYQEAFKKMSKVDRDKWTENGISPEVQGKQTDEGARLREKMQRVKKEHGR